MVSFRAAAANLSHLYCTFTDLEMIILFGSLRKGKKTDAKRLKLWRGMAADGKLTRSAEEMEARFDELWKLIDLQRDCG